MPAFYKNLIIQIFFVGKPKSFFIQACRGSTIQDGVETDAINSAVPIDADIFKFYATTPGKLSLKNKIFTDLLINITCTFLFYFMWQMK